jgi:hypothetical protein
MGAANLPIDAPSLLLRHPGYMTGDAFVGQQFFAGCVPLAEFFLVDQVVEARVARPAEIEAARPHLLDRVALAEPGLPVILARDEVVERQRLVPTAKLAAVGDGLP